MIGVKSIGGKCPCERCQKPRPRVVRTDDGRGFRFETPEEQAQRKNLARFQRRYNRRSN